MMSWSHIYSPLDTDSVFKFQADLAAPTGFTNPFTLLWPSSSVLSLWLATAHVLFVLFCFLPLRGRNILNSNKMLLCTWRNFGVCGSAAECWGEPVVTLSPLSSQSWLVTQHGGSIVTLFHHPCVLSPLELRAYTTGSFKPRSKLYQNLWKFKTQVMSTCFELWFWKSTIESRGY